MEKEFNEFRKVAYFAISILLISYVLFTIVFLTRNNYDVNNDGKVNAQDYTEIKNYIMNKEN